jgi:hypothetical protein
MKPEGPLPCSHIHNVSQMHPVHNLPPYFPKIHSNINFPSTFRYSKWSLPFWFANQSIVCIYRLSRACYMPYPSHPP